MFIRRLILIVLLLPVLTVAAQDVVDCESETLEIWQIQGAGAAANCDGERIILAENIVTAAGTNGFFIQTPPERSDNDPLTSDGIYVFTDFPSQGLGVDVGMWVTVEGRIDEFYDLTQIEVSRRRVTVLDAEPVMLEPIDLTTTELDWTVGEDVHPLERYEGMLVTVRDTQTVAPTNYFDEFGISLTGERAFREMGVEIDLNPEFAGQGLPQFDLNPELLEVDPPEMGLEVRHVPVGSTVTVVGGLGYAYQDYQIWPRELLIEEADYAPRPVRAAAEGEFTIATQNVENLFDTVDDPFRQDDVFEDYVPSNAEAYALNLRKVSVQIREVLNAPDIVALQEVENLRVLTDLAYTINADDPSLRYVPCLMEGNDGRGIDNGYLINVERVNVSACFTMPGTRDIARDPTDNSDLFGRPPLILEADLLTGDAPLRLTLINLHIKSLSGVETDRVQARRMAQAVMVAEYVQGLLNQDPDAHIVVLGDLNGFEVSDGLVDVVNIIAGTHDPSQARMAPAQDLVEPDLVNQVLRVPRADRYSYIYNSTSQVLDHILTSPALDALVTDAQFSRGNADGLTIWEEADNGALRSSDHDGFVIYIAPATGE